MNALFWRRGHKVREEELSAYVDGELDGTALGRVEGHLDSCAACRDTVAELRAVGRALSELPRARAPRSFALRQADVGAAPQARTGGLLAGAAPLLSGVTAVALLAFVVLVGVDITRDGATGDLVSTERLAGLEQTLEDAAAEPAPDAPGDVADGGIGTASDAGTSEDEDIDESQPSEARRDPEPDLYGGENETDAAASEGEDRDGLRAGEAAAAAVALVAGGSAAAIWWRRRRPAAF